MQTKSPKAVVNAVPERDKNAQLFARSELILNALMNCVIVESAAGKVSPIHAHFFFATLDKSFVPLLHTSFAKTSRT